MTHYLLDQYRRDLKHVEFNEVVLKQTRDKQDLIVFNKGRKFYYKSVRNAKKDIRFFRKRSRQSLRGYNNDAEKYRW